MLFIVDWEDEGGINPSYTHLTSKCQKKMGGVKLLQKLVGSILLAGVFGSTQVTLIGIP